MKSIWTMALSLAVGIMTITSSGCTKSAAGPATETDGGITGYGICSTDSVQVGNVSVTEMPGGEAKVSISMERSWLARYQGPFSCELLNSEPVARLNPLDPSTGRSETTPVVSADKKLTVSYDALRFTRDLRLWISDGENKVIATSKLR